jgi:hypothetical protein
MASSYGATSHPHPYVSHGPSTSHRQRSSDTGYSEQDFHPLPAVTSTSPNDAERFLDAVGEDEVQESFNALLGQMLGSTIDMSPSLPHRQQSSNSVHPDTLAMPPPSFSKNSTTFISSQSDANSTLTTPPRERLPSSASMSSIGGSLRGRRAPAPAALDLSPRSERLVRSDATIRKEKYGALGGLGAPVGLHPTRRVVTDSQLARVRQIRALC